MTMKTTLSLLAAFAFCLGLHAAPATKEAEVLRWDDFNLTGDLSGGNAAFTLSGSVKVNSSSGGSLPLLTGNAGLTSWTAPKADVVYDQGRYVLRVTRSGTYRVELKFNAKVTHDNAWNIASFDVVSSPLRPLKLTGLPADTQFQLTGASPPQRNGANFECFLQSSGGIQLKWKEAKTEELGKLFFSARGTIQAWVSAGLLRQDQVVEFKIMQGELSQMAFDVIGENVDVSRVTGENILGWNIEPATNGHRLLKIRLNQARRDRYALRIESQMALGVFPQKVQPMRLIPVEVRDTGGTQTLEPVRYDGYFLVANDGAVRLESTEARGLSQIPPEMFPWADPASAPKGQVFAYRFSSGDYSLALQADNILPELAVSEMLNYHVGETELSIEGEMELDIREAPLREFTLRVPSDYTVSRLNIARMSEYAVLPDDAGNAPGYSKLQVLFTAPLSGRQVMQLRLEKNQNAVAGPWKLPALVPLNVKSARGYVGVSSDVGLRLAPGAITGLSEVANAYFPRKVAGLQTAYRLRENQWSATINVERQTLSVQVDATHIFTVNEGIAYGSSVLQYLISGTPVSTLKVAVPADYGNVEFTGRDVRSWKKVGDLYEVYLHTPAFGSYTLLTTYDRKFDSQSTNAVSFTGARVADVQSEQGTVFVVSEQQFQVKTAAATAGLLQLDPGEIAPEQRLLFDAPILAAYQYTARPFDLSLTLQSLALGQTVHQVVDRASIQTQVSREGELVTTARYYLKSQGHSHLRVALPPDAQLWETKVAGSKVVPVTDRDATLIPLPEKSDPGAIIEVELKLASKSAGKDAVKARTPSLDVPVLLTDWNLSPDSKNQLKYESGSVPPTLGLEQSGYAWMARAWDSPNYRMRAFVAIPTLALFGLFFVGWGASKGAYRWTWRWVAGGLLGLGAMAASVFLLLSSMSDAFVFTKTVAPGLSLSAPVQEAGQFLMVEAANLEQDKVASESWASWPAALGFVLLIARFFTLKPGAPRLAIILVGWLLVVWGALRLSNGAEVFFGAMAVFVIVEIAIPAVCFLLRSPSKPKPEPPAMPSAAESVSPVVPPAAPSAGSATGSATALLLAGLFSVSGFFGAQAAAPVNAVQSITQEGRVTNDVVFIKTKLVWDADKDQKLNFLAGSAVLTRLDFPHNKLTLDGARTLTVTQSGRQEISFEYQMAIASASRSFMLPTPAGLINRFTLEVTKADVDVLCDNAVSIQTTHTTAPETTRAQMVLTPAAQAVIAWRPKARDTRSEKPVFYSELWHLFVPASGVIEGVHRLEIRPAQGQLEDIAFQVPIGMTISDVRAEGASNFVSNWRFDPDQRQLRVQFSQALAKPFAFQVRSQVGMGPLPYEQEVGLISVLQSAGQIGSVALATASDVQLGSPKNTNYANLSAINLEDFPNSLVPAGLTVRKAFRYSNPEAKVTVCAVAVQPDVRVETQETLSLGEERAVLASSLTVHITRAGIFKLSFALPRDFEGRIIDWRRAESLDPTQGG